VRIQKLQIARRTLQVAVVLLILAVPVLARYNNYLAAREIDKVLEKWDGTLQGRTLSLLDASLRQLPDGEKHRDERTVRNRQRLMQYAQGVRGGPWSLGIGALSMTEPLAAAESLAARKGASRVLWIGLIVPLLAALVLGRVYCSWVCPMGLLLEFTDKLRRALRWLELRPHDVHVSRATKYVLLIVGLGLSAVVSLPVLGYAYPPALLGRELHDLVFGMFDRAEMGSFGFWLGGLTWMSLVLLAIAVLEITVSRRWWCRYVCPGGALYSVLGWLRPVRVQRNALACTSCGLCDKACHLGLTPMQDRFGPECDNCGLCISNCTDDAIGYVVRVRDREPAATTQPVVRSVRVAALALVVLAGAAGETAAHHILGIPHYAYDERYPQVPILTYRVLAGTHDFEMTGYPGMPRPGEQSFLNVYVRDKDSGAPFDGIVRLEVRRDRLIGDDPVVYGPVQAHLEESVYKFYPRFEDEANYTIRISWDVEGVPWIIDLPMVVGKPGSPWAVMAGFAGGIGAFLIVIRAARIKLRRRARRTRAHTAPVPPPAVAARGASEGART
jgi:ferredoxin-type protein NapH